MDPTLVGGVLGAGANVVGGVMGQRNQAAINTQNINAATTMAQYGLTWRVQDAIRAGINPLAALGSNFSPGPATAVGTDAMASGMSGMGQNLARALQAYGDKVSKTEQLNQQYRQAQIDALHSEAARNLASAHSVLQTQPGSPPGLPLPREDPRYEPEIKPSMQRWETSGGRISTPSREFTGATFSIDPAGILHALGAELGNISQPWFLRPDVMRSTVQPYNPADFGGGM